MKTDLPHILIIDDDITIIRALTLALRKEFYPLATTSPKEGLDIARRRRPPLAMVDLRMPETNGIEVLKELRKIDPEMKVLIMTAYGEVSKVIAAFKEGAIDFITKPFDNVALVENIKRLIIPQPDKRPYSSGIPEIIAESDTMKYVWELVNRFAPTDLPVLITGETGTGKELFARLIHGMSYRSKGPFVPVDCSAIPPSLIESELFGYEKGAFTGASAFKEGLFESAHMGTLFLDEVGNLPLSLQGKLLRVTQEHSIIHLGSKGYHPIPIDIRIIAATNIDLVEACKRGEFRPDLYYRISVASVKLPPLRERHGDIPRLIDHFLEECKKVFKKSVGISEEVMKILNNYHWPGNIRELENVIRSSFIKADACIYPHHLPP